MNYLTDLDHSNHYVDLFHRSFPLFPLPDVYACLYMCVIFNKQFKHNLDFGVCPRLRLVCFSVYLK